ncbi:MAG TPA: HAD-IC family P-type ATPase, partial [Chitinophagaceae bacterium]|nr:HAD-IC family P-type ATPase [Chitinophagaceae bacterium]
MQNNNFTFTGLTTEEVLYARQQHGENKLQYKKENAFTRAVTGLIKEPMVILLLAASVIYFISGNMGDAFFLAASIILVAAISLYQDNRSRNALKKLEAYTSPTCKVIRNGHTEEINSGEVVTGDFIIAEEGTTVAADGEIVQSNDFSVNESILTGESLPVYKASDSQDNKVYMGTTVGSGLAIIKTTAIGNNTKLGSIGKSLEAIKQEKTPLELQVNNFVKKMVAAGAVVFVIVWGINFYNSHSVLDSLLKALTLAMSILPEEIPVAFTTFMALGAWRLMKMGIIVKQMKTVETLGSATVICTDKTGTLTENKMSLAKIFTLSSRRIISAAHNLHADEKGLVRIAMWASEPIPFDPMEKALHDAYSKLAVEDERPLYHMAHEYPLGGKPPMMTHIFEDVAGNRIIAAKGAPEAIMAVCKLSPAEKSHVENALQEIAVEGYRVLGVAEGFFEGNNFPAKQQQLPFTFKGLVAFYDPPKKNIAHVLKAFYRA